MLLDIAQDDPSEKSARYIIGYRFLVNFKDDEGNYLSSLYACSIKVQRFLFKNGMVEKIFFLKKIFLH